MTKEQIYNAVCDIAEDAGVSTDELISALTEQSATMFEENLNAMPAELADYVKSARTEKAALRQSRRQKEDEQRLAEEVRRFCKAFPNVDANSIPEAVWADMEKGIPLAYAYAMHTLCGENSTNYANSVNARNTDNALPPVAEGANEGEYSMEDVEAMSPAAVKKNFSRILRSMGKWKIQ